MADLSNYLKSQYASALESELSGLENAYKQATAAMDRTAQEIPQQYEAQRNTVAATNALEKQAFDERANAMGLNTGTSGQAQLARSSMYQRDLAGIGAAEANAQADLALQRTQRQAEYEAAIAAAKAESDAALNSALYAEMVRQQELAAAQAAAAAKAAASTSGGGGGSGYDNGGLSTAVIKKMQEELNKGLPANQQIAVDGKWGAETTAAASGLSAKEMYAAYQPRTQTGNSWSNVR